MRSDPEPGPDRMTASTLGLLMFNLDENAAILRRVRALHSVVDEIVVVDSSDPSTSAELSSALVPFHARVVRVIPLGYVDPLRGFGLRQVRSDHVLLLDADEEPSPALMSALRRLSGHDAYVVPRYEVGLRSYTYHMRLFRPDAVAYRGRSYDFPQVRGRVGRLVPPYVLVHPLDPRTYLRDKDRARRYFTVEILERPFTRAYACERLVLRGGHAEVRLPLPRSFFSSPGSPLSPAAVHFIITLELARDLMQGKGPRAAAFNRRYALGKWHFFQGLPEPERRRTAVIAEEIRRSGGLPGYLGLTEPGYLERLTASFRWDRSGLDVYRELIEYRHEHGRPMATWGGG